MSKRLVAYFSASGVTAKVAENLADAIGADIFEIQPEVPYTKADLNWMDKKARSTIEMSDPTSRPAIAAKRDNMDEYILRLICLLSEQSYSDKDIVVNRKEVQDLFPFPAASLIRYYLPDFDFYIVSL